MVLVLVDTIDDWRELYERDFFSADREILGWFGRYCIDVFSGSREVDDWYSMYRRDFLPKRFGGSSSVGGAVSVLGHSGEVLFSDLVQVGRGEVTNPAKCGKFLGYYTCLQHEKHEGGVVEAHVCFNYCCRPSCPRCFYYGWSVRNGRDVEVRMLEAEKMFGLRCEHIMVSLPVDDYDLSFEDVKKKVKLVLADRGVFGGYMLPHRNRVHEFTRVEYFSGHMHVLGFVKGGYDRCRNCVHFGGECTKGCDGFDEREYQGRARDGYVVKVMGERKTLYGTVFYQANHASMNPFKRRSRVGTYFGKCGYNNLRANAVKPKAVCGLCGSSMGFADYVGGKRFVTDRASHGFVKMLHEPFFEDGKPAWVMKEFGGSV